MGKCIGCGAKLQFVDPLAIGYVPLEVSSDLGEDTYCKRCYQIMYHGAKYKPIISNKDYYNKIDIIKNKKNIVVLMVDVLNIYASFIPNLKKHIGDASLIIVINKVDIMPKDIHLKNIEKRIRELASIEGLDVASVIAISAKKKQNIDLVLNKILKIKENIYKKDHIKDRDIDCYFLGCASVGKSSFINAVKELYLPNKKLITTSDQYQTTLDFIRVYIDKTNSIIDTPGLINYNSYGAYLEYDSMKILTPKTYIKPKTYQLNPDQTIFLGGLVRIDFINGSSINASTYVSNELYVHRTKTSNATKLFEENKIKLLKPPLFNEEYEKIKNFKTCSFEFNEGAYDLLINGVGFVHLVGVDVKINVTLFENIDVKLVETFL